MCLGLGLALLTLNITIARISPLWPPREFVRRNLSGAHVYSPSHPLIPHALRTQHAASLQEFWYVRLPGLQSSEPAPEVTSGSEGSFDNWFISPDSQGAVYALTLDVDIFSQGFIWPLRRITRSIYNTRPASASAELSPPPALMTNLWQLVRAHEADRVNTDPALTAPLRAESSPRPTTRSHTFITSRHLWQGYAHLAATLAGVALCIASLMQFPRWCKTRSRAALAKAHRCPKCGYSLTGTRPPCPECGYPPDYRR